MSGALESMTIMAGNMAEASGHGAGTVSEILHLETQPQGKEKDWE